MFKGSRKDREGSEKRKVLRGLIDAEGEKLTNAIIFCNRKTDVDIVAKSLKSYKYDAAPIHGDLDQSQRTRTLDGFRNGELRILVASDVAARGLDVPSVSHVFNFDVPGHPEDYVHRIGRTGRAGREGKAITICVPRDEKPFDAVEKLIQKEIPRLDNPVKSAKPVENTEEKPKSTRSRSSRAKTEPKAETSAKTPSDTKSEAPREATSSTSRSRASSSRSRASSSRDDHRSGNKVVGLGDHTPSFIGLSFEERMAS